MRKLFLIAAVAALTMNVALWSSTITVTSPSSGNEWCLGSTYTITWTKSGAMQATVAVRLRRAGAPESELAVVNITDSTANNGSLSWTVPASVPAGDYFIRVRTSSPDVIGDSVNFKIKSCAPSVELPIKLRAAQTKFGQTSACMVITSPKAGDIADPFNYVNVKWTKYGNLDPKVSITLMRPGRGSMFTGVTVVASMDNSGSFPWNLTSLMPAPGVYFVRVRTLDGKCEARSGEFTINEVGSIILQSPLGGEVWENGTSHAVTWKRTGNIQTLEILLNRQGSWSHTLAQGVDAKLGSKTCTFVRGDTDGANPICYKVFTNHLSKMSGCITLTGNPDLAITNVGYSGLFYVGHDMTFTVKVENKGVVVSQPCQGDLKVNGVTAKTFPVPAIQPGQSVNVSVTWKVACPGALKITIDTGGANIEADKANNVWENNLC